MIKRKKHPDKPNIFFISDKPDKPMYCLLSRRKLQSNNRQCFFF